MILIITQYHGINCVGAFLINYLPMLRKTFIINSESCRGVNDLFLQNILIAAVIDELDILFTKKLASKPSQNVKINLTKPHAIVLYSALLNMPVSPNDVYVDWVRNNWVSQIHKQII